MDAIHQLKFMEVDQQANGDVEQFHVAEQLGLVDRQYLLDRFEFQQQAAFDQNVETKRLFEDKTLVFDSDNALVDSGQLAEAQLIGFEEKWMRELILQKETKETKKEPKPSSSRSSPLCLQMLFVDAR